MAAVSEAPSTESVAKGRSTIYQESSRRNPVVRVVCVVLWCDVCVVCDVCTMVRKIYGRVVVFARGVVVCCLAWRAVYCCVCVGCSVVSCVCEVCVV